MIIMGKDKWNWGTLSKHRAALMGLSIIIVILFHGNKTKMIFGGSMTWLDWILSNGNIGVEIFLFLSGFGLYVSFSRNNSIKQFYKKRLMRVVIPYAILGGAFLVAEDLIRVHMKRSSGLYIMKDFSHFISDWTLWSFWSEGSKKFWYIALIILLYLLFPLFYHIIFPNNQRKNSTLRWLCCMVIIVGGIFMIRHYCLSWYSSTEIALTRFPIFLTGIYCGPMIVAKEPIKKKHWFVLVILLVICGYIVATDHYVGIYRRYTFTVVSLLLCIVFCIFLEVIQTYFKKDYLYRFLVLCGKYSLELYIAHVAVRRIFMRQHFKYTYWGHNFNKWGVLNYLLVILWTIVAVAIFTWAKKGFEVTFFEKKQAID